jgi:D-alanyl-D-alanine carboxypeptidase (penicillin-binding protein 5/6)
MVVALLAPLGAPATAAPPEPQISAPSAIVIDARTGESLWAREPTARRQIASATKLMTALLTLEDAEPGDVFTAPAYSAGAAESKIGLREGERMTVRDLLEALLLESANDAAFALAENIGGSQSEFVAEMNVKADDLGLRNTSYANPIGLDDQFNYSSAGDLAKLGALLLREPLFARIVDMPMARLATGSRPRTVANRNDLIARYPFVDGIKTGHTSQAGYVLVGAAHGKGAQVVSVVLGTASEASRDAESLELLRYGLAQFRRARPVQAGQPLARPKVRFFGDDRVRLEAASDVALTVRRGKSLRTRVDAPAEVEGPLPAGRKVGTVEVVYRGRVVRTVPLVTAARVPGAGFSRKAGEALGGTLPALALVLLLGAAALVAFRVRSRRGSRGGRSSDDHHRHAQRRDRQDARGAELPARPPPPGGGADVDGGGQGRKRRTRA